MLDSNIPLADLIRPKNLDEFVGQKHLIGENKPIRLAVENGKLFSMIFWGPPGCGKTTLARILANAVDADFYNLSAVSAKKSDIKKIIDFSKKKQLSNRTVLFLDEIHRFNKAQQDYLLPYVENGTLTLIGATTENPSFEVIGPLLSRCRVFVLKELTPLEIEEIIKRALDHLGKLKIDADAKDWLINVSCGDARQTITLLENAFQLFKAKIAKNKTITLEILKETLQSPYLRYDRAGEEHYNTISAFIKSMRASNVDAALYYLARMVAAGEDPLFIARRMIIFASEDIGMAVPTALVVANEVFRACDAIGYPECAINLAHGTVYLAKCKKDRSAYNAYFAALKDVQEFGNLPIPLKIRNAPTKLMKNLGYGRGYEKYTKESLLPEKIKGRKYYKK